MNVIDVIFVLETVLVFGFEGALFLASDENSDDTPRPHGRIRMQISILLPLLVKHTLGTLILWECTGPSSDSGPDIEYSRWVYFVCSFSVCCSLCVCVCVLFRRHFVFFFLWGMFVFFLFLPTTLFQTLARMTFIVLRGGYKQCR